MGDMIFCEDPAFLNMIYIFKNAISLLSIIAPIVLIIAVMLDVVKAVTAQGDEITKILGKCKKKLFAGAMVFLVPTIMFYVFTLMTSENTNVFCFEEATRENIDAIEALQAAERKSLVDKRNEQNVEALNTGSGTGGYSNYGIGSFKNNTNVGSMSVPSSTSLDPYVNGKQVVTLANGKCMSFSENCYCPTNKGLTGFSFIMKDKASRDFAEIRGGDKQVTVTVKCTNGFTISRQVNEKTKAKFEGAFQNICVLITTGINGLKINTSNLSIGGTYVTRLISGRIACSRHAYGGAIDINSATNYTIAGKQYTPYGGQGNSTRIEYDRFVKALGNESDPRNVNYILWIYAFKPYGFTWGGDWSNSQFDPMHFEVGA